LTAMLIMLAVVIFLTIVIFLTWTAWNDGHLGWPHPARSGTVSISQTRMWGTSRISTHRFNMP
jgi:hypothetical protein